MSDVEFVAGDGVRLAGTLTPAESGIARGAVLLVSGSGSLDRDSNMAHQRLDVAVTLAESLARAGVASLRYDKRGVGALREAEGRWAVGAGRPLR